MFPRASTDRIPLKAKDSSVVLCVLGMYTVLGLVPSMLKKIFFDGQVAIIRTGGGLGEP